MSATEQSCDRDRDIEEEEDGEDEDDEDFNALDGEEGSGESEAEEEEEEEAPARSKRKSRVETDSEDEQPRKRPKKSKQAASEPKSFNFRITTLVPKDIIPTRSGGKKSSSSKFNLANYIQKDPFKFPSDGSYQAFLTAVARTLDCSVNLLQSKSLEYKFKVPLTSPVLAMGSAVSFEAFIDEVINKTVTKRDVFLLSLPPLKLDAYEAVSALFSFFSAEHQTNEC